VTTHQVYTRGLVLHRLLFIHSPIKLIFKENLAHYFSPFPSPPFPFLLFPSIFSFFPFPFLSPSKPISFPNSLPFHAVLPQQLGALNLGTVSGECCELPQCARDRAPAEQALLAYLGCRKRVYWHQLWVIFIRTVCAFEAKKLHLSSECLA